MKHDWSSAGDVKYHLGTSMDRSYPDGRRVHLSLVANPSHLEVGTCADDLFAHVYMSVHATIVRQ